ncbi:MAG: beta-ketoacyl synthase chain length factor [Marinilabiliaceae bacterium]|nr:beta-ketoacyl synthase chain length factor [Marinilabiliaceae bacterium]
MSLYIFSASHISIQEPDSEKWFDEPIFYNSRYVRSIEPDFNLFLSQMVSRRMGKILKRALTTALCALKKSDIVMPDAIITGTGLGCIENTEKFLNSMIDNNEELLSPSFFMQSTHNTISSQIALHLKCNGYNSTYSHRGTSFDAALLDAIMQLELGDISNALVGGHDELTPDYFNLLDKIGYWKKGEISNEILSKSNSKGSFAGECSISFMLGNININNAICEIKGMEMFHNPIPEYLFSEMETLLHNNNSNIHKIDAIVAGINGDIENDKIYTDFQTRFFPNKPLIFYKHIFGESYTASGLGLYTAATILQKGKIPQNLFYSNYKKDIKPQNILIYNHFQNIDHTFIYISSC